MNQQDLKTVLDALNTSSPHTDAQYRWKDPAWIALRQEAIDIVSRLLAHQLALRQACKQTTSRPK